MTTVQLLEKLIAFRPVSSDTEQVNAATRFLAELLAENGLHTQIETLDNRLILYAATEATKKPALFANAHLEVVAAEDECFTLRESNGWLLGRGTADCLGNCAALANALIAANNTASAGVLFSTDEETGGATTAHMAGLGYAGRKMILICDNAAPYTIATAQKGMLNLRLRAAGKSCHSAQPWEGDNAIDKLIDGYCRVRALFPPVEAGDEWHDTMAATVIGGGNVVNKVPDSADMVINLRLTEKDSVETTIRDIEKVSGCQVITELQSPPVYVDEKEPALKTLKKLLEETLGRPLQIRRMNGATDARHFANVGVPIAMIGAPGTGIHGSEERVEQAGLERFAAFLQAYVNQTVAHKR